MPPLCHPPHSPFVPPSSRPLCATLLTPPFCHPPHAPFVPPSSRPLCATLLTPPLCHPPHAPFVPPSSRPLCATLLTPPLCHPPHAPFLPPSSRPLCATLLTPPLCHPPHAPFFRQEFFTSPDHFQSQLEGQLKEMEAIVEQLLSFGKEDASLLGHTLQQLKNTCHVTCSRVGGPVM